jgi:hypothetical protein
MITNWIVTGTPITREVQLELAQEAERDFELQYTTQWTKFYQCPRKRSGGVHGPGFNMRRVPSESLLEVMILGRGGVDGGDEDLVPDVCGLSLMESIEGMGFILPSSSVDGKRYPYKLESVFAARSRYSKRSNKLCTLLQPSWDNRYKRRYGAFARAIMVFDVLARPEKPSRHPRHNGKYDLDGKKPASQTRRCTWSPLPLRSKGSRNPGLYGLILLKLEARKSSWANALPCL